MKTITLPVEPLPCPRPRITVRGKFAHAYYPQSYKNWKAAVANLIENRRVGMVPHVGPLAVAIRVFPTKPRTSKLDRPKPDLDNYAKSVLDACTAAGVWEDDSQVVTLSVEKDWSPTGEGFIEIDIERI